MSKKKYHLRITENETGRAVHDVDTSCVLGAFTRDFETMDTSGIAVVGGISTLEYCIALITLEKVIENIYREYPELREGVSILKSTVGIGMIDLSKLQEMVENLNNPSTEN